MKFKTLFMSDEKNTAIILICHSFLICQSNSWPLHGGLSAECVQVNLSWAGVFRELALRPWPQAGLLFKLKLFLRGEASFF